MKKKIKIVVTVLVVIFVAEVLAFVWGNIYIKTMSKSLQDVQKADYASETAYRSSEKKMYIKFVNGEMFPDTDYRSQIIEVKRDSANCEKRTAAADNFFK